MNPDLDTLIRSAYAAEGEMEDVSLHARTGSARRSGRRRAPRALIATGVFVLVVATSAAAKVLLERRLLFENGILAGRVTTDESGNSLVEIRDSGKPLETRTFEVRTESGEVVGEMAIGKSVEPSPRTGR